MEKKKSYDWKKIAKRAGIGVGAAAVGGYALLFTGPGNAVVGSYVEMMINSDPKVPVTVERFSMQTDHIDMQLRVADVIDARVYGDYSLFGGDFRGNFDLYISDMNRINIAQLKEAGARGSFRTGGSITSTEEGYVLRGDSAMYGGNLRYTLNLQDTTLTSATINLENAKLSTILRQGGEAPVAEGVLNIEADLPSLEEGAISGTVLTTLAEGRLDEKAYRRHYGKKAPEGFRFSTKINSKLSGDEIRSIVDFDSTYATLDVKEVGINLRSRKLWGDYTATLTPNLPSQPEKKIAPLTTSGTIGGTIDKAVIAGKSGIYGSDTSYTLQFMGDALQKVTADLKGISLAALSREMGEKPGADAAIDVAVRIDDAREGRLSGTITSDMHSFKPNSRQLKETFGTEVSDNFKLTMHSKTTLEGTTAWIDTQMVTDVGRFDMEHARYDLKHGYLEGAYTLKSANFAQLAKTGGFKDDLPKELVSSSGSVEINGVIRSGERLHVTGETEIFGGKMAFVLDDSDLKVDLINAGMDLKKQGRSVYSAKANGTLKHNLKSKKGSALFTLAQGDTLLEVKEATYDAPQQKIDASIMMSGYGKYLKCDVKGSYKNPSIVMKSDKPLIGERYKAMMLKEIDANVDDARQREQIKRLVTFLSRDDATLTQKEMQEIEKALQEMVAMLKSEYSKLKNVKFTKAHFDNLQALSEKMRKEKGVLSDADIAEVERRSKAIVKAIKSEWNSEGNRQKREQTLEYFERLGTAMEDARIDGNEVDRLKAELNRAIDNYQSILSDKQRVEKELKKYEPLERIAKMFGEKKAFDKERIFEIIAAFNVMMDKVQERIVQSDLTEEQQQILRDIGRALKEMPKSLAQGEMPTRG